MTEQEAVQKVMKIIGPYARNLEAVPKAGAETRLWEDLHVNSARFIDILLDFEKEFDVQLDDNTIERVVTVGDVARVLLNIMGDKSVSPEHPSAPTPAP